MRSLLKPFASMALLALPMMASADPLDPSHVPADSKWVAHLDMDAARKTSTWKSLYDRLSRNMEFTANVTELETVFNARFPDDLHDVTLSGAGFGDTAAVVLVHAVVDRKQIEAGLAMNKSYFNEPHGDHHLLTWEDKGKTNYGGFFSDTQFLVGQDKQRVAAMFDTLDGKSPALKPDTVLAKGAGNGLMVYIAGDELAKLREVQGAKSPLLTQMKSAWIGLTEDKDSLVLKLNVLATDSASAVKMKSAAEGIYAAISLAADNADADPRMKFVAGLKPDIQVKDNLATLEIKLANKDVETLIDQVVTAKETEARKK